MKKMGLAVIVVGVFLAGCATTPAPQEQGTASTKLEWGKEYSVEVLETVEEFGFFNGFTLVPFTGSNLMGIDPVLVQYVNDTIRSGLEERDLLTSAGQKVDLSGEIMSVSFEADRAVMKARVQLTDAHNELPLSTVEVESRGLDRTAAREALTTGILEYLSGVVKKE